MEYTTQTTIKLEFTLDESKAVNDRLIQDTLSALNRTETVYASVDISPHTGALYSITAHIRTDGKPNLGTIKAVEGILENAFNPKARMNHKRIANIFQGSAGRWYIQECGGAPLKPGAQNYSTRRMAISVARFSNEYTHYVSASGKVVKL